MLCVVLTQPSEDPLISEYKPPAPQTTGMEDVAMSPKSHHLFPDKHGLNPDFNSNNNKKNEYKKLMKERTDPRGSNGYCKCCQLFLTNPK